MLLGKEKHGHLKYAELCDGTGCREGGAAIPKVNGLGDGAIAARRSFDLSITGIPNLRTAELTILPARTKALYI